MSDKLSTSLEIKLQDRVTVLEQELAAVRNKYTHAQALIARFRESREHWQGKAQEAMENFMLLRTQVEELEAKLEAKLNPSYGLKKTCDRCGGEFDIFNGVITGAVEVVSVEGPTYLVHETCTFLGDKPA